MVSVVLGNREFGAEGGVAKSVRDTLAKAGPRFWRPDQLGPPSDRQAIMDELSKIVLGQKGEDIPLIRVQRGVYWTGPPPEPLQVALEVAQIKEGIGYAGASAAFDLGLRNEKPAVTEIAFAKRPPRKISWLDASWVSRAGRLDRIINHLNAKEVAVLEVLEDPTVITIETDQALARLAELLDLETVGASALARASDSEPARTRAGLQNLLAATGRTQLSEQIRPVQSRNAEETAFLADRSD